ncbi:unnamed protein product [Camellia sinensis]
MNNRQSMEIGKENPDIFFTDREGRRNTNLSWGIDKERVLKGKSAIEFHTSTSNTLDYVMWQANTIVESLGSVLDYLEAAKHIRLGHQLD